MNAAERYLRSSIAERIANASGSEISADELVLAEIAASALEYVGEQYGKAMFAVRPLAQEDRIVSPAGVDATTSSTSAGSGDVPGAVAPTPPASAPGASPASGAAPSSVATTADAGAHERDDLPSTPNEGDRHAQLLGRVQLRARAVFTTDEQRHKFLASAVRSLPSRAYLDVTTSTVLGALRNLDAAELAIVLDKIDQYGAATRRNEEERPA